MANRLDAFAFRAMSLPLRGLAAALAFKRSVRPPRRRPVRRLLVIRNDGMGDLVLSLPAVHALRQRHPDAHLAVLVRQEWADLVTLLPGIDEVIPTRSPSSWGESLALWAALVSRRFDSSIDLSGAPALRTALITLLAGIGQRFGYEGHRGHLPGRLLTQPFRLERPARETWETQIALGIAQRALGASPGVVPAPDLGPEAAAEREALRRGAGLEEGDELVGFNLNVSPTNPLRAWDPGRFAQLINRFGAETRLRPLITGSEADLPLWRRIETQLTVPVVARVGCTTARELCLWLTACRLFIGNNTGPIQLAVYLGTPTVVINGPSGLLRWAPRAPGHRIVSRWLPCSFVDCSGAGCQLGFACIRDIGVDEVYTAARSLAAL